MNPKDYTWTDIGWTDTGFAKGGHVEASHVCGCGNPNAAPPCWHCTSCPECNCEVCDDWHQTCAGEICPELQFLNPILYQEKLEEQKAKEMAALKNYKLLTFKELGKKLLADETLKMQMMGKWNTW